MKKIGIITLYDDINIGNKLQNYAVQQYFKNYNLDVSTIPHWEMAHKPLTMGNIKILIMTLVGFPKDKARKFRLDIKRKRLFKEFSDKYLRLDKCVKIEKLPKNLCEEYDYFVTGSDQVWHNWTNSANEISYFFLRFAKEYQRLTIAPSFGKEKIEEQFYECYKHGIQGIPVLTCREKQGAKMVYDLTGKKATVILDPTMLIDTEQWISIEKKPELFEETKYILIYMLGNVSKDIQVFIDNISKNNNLKIINIYDVNEPSLYLTTPDEFIYYIRHAELVITDSFHASVFSILFKSNFIVVNRDTQSMGNMTSRLDTLLDTFGLSDRKYNRLNTNNIFKSDFSRINNILEQEREKAKKLYQTTFGYLDDLKMRSED